MANFRIQDVDGYVFRYDPLYFADAAQYACGTRGGHSGEAKSRYLGKFSDRLGAIAQ